MATLVMNGNGSQFRIKSQTKTTPKMLVISNGVVKVIDVQEDTDVEFVA